MNDGHSTTTPELLAPAGDWDAMRAAVANGADAVYFGLDHFNARHRATNFKLDELPQVMDYLHKHNVKGFVTFNTLIFSEEIPEAAAYLAKLAESGVDAVLVQDLGIADMLHRMVPALPIHGSTQMTLTEPRGIRFAQQFGVQRVVLARELSIADITRIASALQTPAETLSPSSPAAPELEVFVHGALCVSYSGQCLTSESFGGRSANRGQCAQACRLPYQLIVDGQVRDLGDKQYLLSPSDLAAYDLIADLTRIGVACFKIEGRLKSAHYVAATTQTYRAAIDHAVSHFPPGQSQHLTPGESHHLTPGESPGAKFQITEQQKLDLEQTFSRSFTHGFLGGANHQQLVSAKFSKARGTRLGTVETVSAGGITVRLETGNWTLETLLKPGDGVVFDEGRPEQDEQGGRVFHVRPLPDHRVEIQLGHGDINLAYINPGASVWKTDDPHIKRRLEHSFSRDTVARRVPIRFIVNAHVGQTLQIVAEAEGHRAEAAYTEKTLEKANKFPFDEKTAREQLSRLGETPYELDDLHLHLGGGPMVPKSVLNDLRRQCVESLLRQRARAHPITDPAIHETLRAGILTQFPLPNSAVPTSPALHVLVRTLEQLEAILAASFPLRPSWIYADFEDVRRYKDAVARCQAARFPIALATLRIVKPGEDGLLNQIAECQPDAVLVRNLAAVSYYHQTRPTLPQIGDYALNVANELTAALFARAGLMRIVPSYDLNWRQLSSMLSRIDPRMFECVIHQHMPMFHMEHCVFAHTLSNGKDFRDCGRPCDRHKVDLGDRIGEPHPLIPDVGCRNTVFNAWAQSAAEFVPEMQKLGVQHFRVELLREDGPGAVRLVDQYARLLSGEAAPKTMVRSLRVLNQLGVTPGTMTHE